MMDFKKLCTPAMLYFVLSAVSFLGMLMQNCTDSSKYKVGTMEVESPCHNAAFFVVKALYIMFWTFGLNWLCKKGFKTVSWALVLLPFLGMFLAIGVVFIALLKGGKKEGMNECDEGYEKDANGNCVQQGGFTGREGMDVDEGYGDNFEANPRVEGNLPPIPSENMEVNGKKRKEGFVEGLTCPEGQEERDGECVPIGDGFGVREGFREGNENECPEGQEMVDGSCVAVDNTSGFGNREGFYEGMSANDAEGYDDTEGMDDEEGMDDDEGFVGGGNWPPVGQLL